MGSELWARSCGLGVVGCRPLPDLEDNVARLEEVVVQSHTGGGQTLERRPGHQGHVGGDEVGEQLVVSPLPQSHLHAQTNLAAGPTLHTDQVATKQKWIEDLLSVLISPESSKVSHYYHSDPPFLLSVEVSSKQSYVIRPGYA